MITCHPSVCLPSVSPPTPLNDFSSETPGPVFLKLYVKGGLKICTNGHGPLIEMTAIPIYGKHTEKIFFSRTRTKKALRLNLSI